MITAALLPIVTAALMLALLLAAWRLLRGPTLADRVLALDTLYIDALALFVVLGIQQGHKLAFEVVLAIGLVGFAGTVALAKFATRGDIAQ